MILRTHVCGNMHARVHGNMSHWAGGSFTQDQYWRFEGPRLICSSHQLLIEVIAVEQQVAQSEGAGSQCHVQAL